MNKPPENNRPRQIQAPTPEPENILATLAVAPAENRARALNPQKIALKLADDYETYFYFYPPDISDDSKKTPKPPVLIIHGIQSHPGWFSPTCFALADAGHPVYCIARRGSGANASPRGHASSISQLFDDLDCAREFVNKQAGGQKIHLAGISWGGKLLACYLAQRPSVQEQVLSATLICPGISAAVDISPRTKLSIGFSLLTGGKKLFDIPLSQPGLFTKNPKMIAYLENDQLALHQATAKFLFLTAKMEKILTRCDHNAIKCRLNLILADRDRIINNAKCKRIVEKITDENFEVHTLVGEHTLDFEADPSAFHQCLRGCLDSKLGI